MKSNYTYRAYCDRVVDGDTLDLVIDLGFHMTTKQRVRLLGVDTPELRSKNPDERYRAREATLRVEELIQEAVDYTFEEQGEFGWYLEITTFKADSFGRWLAIIDLSGGVGDLGGILIEEGHAVPYEK